MVTLNEVRRAARSVVPLNEVQRAAQSVVTPNEVLSVARIGFHSLTHRPHASSRSRFLADHARVSRLQAETVAQRAPVGRQFPAQVEQPHLTAAAQPSVVPHSMDSTAPQRAVARYSSTRCPAHQRSASHHWKTRHSRNPRSKNPSSARRDFVNHRRSVCLPVSPDRSYSAEVRPHAAHVHERSASV